MLNRCINVEDEQFGFQKGFRRVSQIFILCTVIEPNVRI